MKNIFLKSLLFLIFSISLNSKLVYCDVLHNQSDFRQILESEKIIEQQSLVIFINNYQSYLEFAQQENLVFEFFYKFNISLKALPSFLFQFKESQKVLSVNLNEIKLQLDFKNEEKTLREIDKFHDFILFRINPSSETMMNLIDQEFLKNPMREINHLVELLPKLIKYGAQEGDFYYLFSKLNLTQKLQFPAIASYMPMYRVENLIINEIMNTNSFDIRNQESSIITFAMNLINQETFKDRINYSFEYSVEQRNYLANIEVQDKSFDKVTYLIEKRLNFVNFLFEKLSLNDVDKIRLIEQFNILMLNDEYRDKFINSFLKNYPKYNENKANNNFTILIRNKIINTNLYNLKNGGTAFVIGLINLNLKNKKNYNINNIIYDYLINNSERIYEINNIYEYEILKYFVNKMYKYNIEKLYENTTYADLEYKFYKEANIKNQDLINYRLLKTAEDQLKDFRLKEGEKTLKTLMDNYYEKYKGKLMPEAILYRVYSLYLNYFNIIGSLQVSQDLTNKADRFFKNNIKSKDIDNLVYEGKDILPRRNKDFEPLNRTKALGKLRRYSRK